MSIREFLDALRSTQGQHTLASVLEGPESGARLLLPFLFHNGSRGWSNKLYSVGLSSHFVS